MTPSNNNDDIGWSIPWSMNDMVVVNIPHNILQIPMRRNALSIPIIRLPIVTMRRNAHIPQNMVNHAIPTDPLETFKSPYIVNWMDIV